MNIKKVQTVSLTVTESIGGYEADGVATVKEDGKAESIQNGRLMKDGNVIINFTSWNENHLSFDTSDAKSIAATIATVQEFCAAVRATVFSTSASIVNS